MLTPTMSARQAQKFHLSTGLPAYKDGGSFYRGLPDLILEHGVDHVIGLHLSNKGTVNSWKAPQRHRAAELLSQYAAFIHAQTGTDPLPDGLVHLLSELQEHHLKWSDTEATPDLLEKLVTLAWYTETRVNTIVSPGQELSPDNHIGHAARSVVCLAVLESEKQIGIMKHEMTRLLTRHRPPRPAK